MARSSCILGLLLLLLTAGCRNLDKPKCHALFGGDKRCEADLRATNRPVARVFVDREGWLYPPEDFHIDEGQLGALGNGLTNYFGQLTNEWLRLLSEQRLPAEPFSDAAWERCQKRIRSNLVSRLHALLGPEQPRKTLVIPVGGFNVADRRKDYATLEDIILRDHLPANRVVFLEVHWDGLVGMPGVWGAGQHNSTIGGRRFRLLLNELDDDVPLRFITHSRGAAFVSSALWNVDKVIPNSGRRKPWYAAYAAEATNALFATPRQRSIRAGMICPAMPALTFGDYTNRTPAGAALGFERVVIGMNARDIAVSKGIIIGSRCSWLGATDLACVPQRYDDYVAKPLNAGGRTVACRMDFAKSYPGTRCKPREWLRTLYCESHAFADYLERNALPAFLACLFEPL